MNERQFRKRTDQESRARLEARRVEKEDMRRRLAGVLIWRADQGTFNEGRNQAKRERRAMRFGMGPLPARTEPKPVRPAYRVRLPIVRKAKVLTHAPRSRKGSTRPHWIQRAMNRRRDRIARASR